MLTIVQQSVELPASPAALYSMYLDAGQHAAFTGGGAASITPVPGAPWSAFDGRIHGRILALTPSRQIVQSWRSFEWQDDDPDSVLARLYDTLLSGWSSRYWEPWRSFLREAR